VSDQQRELAGLVESRAEKSGDLSDDSLRGEERVVLGGELLDELLVLVQLLQIIDREEIDSDLLSLITVELITEDTDGVVGLSDGGELDGARETLVLLGVVVLQTDLELKSLGVSSSLGLTLGGFLLGLGSSGGLALRGRGQQVFDVLSKLFA